MLTFLLLIVLFAGMYALQAACFGRRALAKVTYRCRFGTDEITEGESLELIEEIENTGLLPLPYIRSEYSVSRFLEFADTHSTITDRTRFVSSLFFLRGRSRITRRWHVTATRRGEYRVERVLLLSSDLLGTTRASRAAQELGGMLTVLPRCWEGEGLRQAARSVHLGEQIVPWGCITDPVTVRDRMPYTGREPMRRMDWKASARTGTLMVRTEEPVQERRICVVFTAQQGEYGKMRVPEETSEHTIRVTAALFRELTDAGEPFSVCSNCMVEGEAVQYPEGCSPGRYHQLLRMLAALDIHPEQTLRDAVQLPPGARLVIVTPFLSEDVRRIKAKHPDAQIILTSPEDPDGLRITEAYEQE